MAQGNTEFRTRYISTYFAFITLLGCYGEVWKQWGFGDVPTAVKYVSGDEDKFFREIVIHK